MVYHKKIKLINYSNEPHYPFNMVHDLILHLLLCHIQMCCTDSSSLPGALCFSCCDSRAAFTGMFGCVAWRGVARCGLLSDVMDTSLRCYYTWHGIILIAWGITIDRDAG